MNNNVCLALASTFSGLGLSPDVTPLRHPTAADGAFAFVVGKPKRRAALLVSPVEYPEVVSEAQARAQLMRDYLGPELGSIILAPLAQGRIEGRSYALLPFGKPLAGNRVLWLMQKPRIKRSLLGWLQAVASHFSVEEVEKSYFENLLQHLRSLPSIDSETRSIATASLERLRDRSFRPRFVPMHNDLWKGNILMPSCPEMKGNRAFSFFLIDWRGSRIKGFPFFDLVRLSMSLKLSPAELRREVVSMSKSIECELSDVQFYLTAALSELSTRLEHFPWSNFKEMTIACFSELKKTNLT